MTSNLDQKSFRMQLRVRKPSQITILEPKRTANKQKRDRKNSLKGRPLQKLVESCTNDNVRISETSSKILKVVLKGSKPAPLSKKLINMYEPLSEEKSIDDVQIIGVGISVRKNMSQFEDLFELVRMNSRAAFIYRQFQCIPLLPEKLIKPTFEKLKSIAEEFNKNAFASFLSYYKDQWIVKEGPNSICVYQKETRTTGAVEAYNGVIGKKMKAHPPFFSFVESLQKEEFSKSTQMMQDLPLIDITKKRKERADRLNRINKATDELTNETITSMQFLEKVANLNNKVMKENHWEPKKPFELDNPDSNQSDSSDNDEELLCLICDQEKAAVLFFPCAHCCICAACWKKRSEETLSKGKTLKCPRIDCKKLVKRHTIISYECTENQ